jgi:hypothetical protein
MTNLNSITKTINFGAGNFISRKFIYIKKTEFEERAGTDRDDLYDSVASNHQNLHGWFIGKNPKINNALLGGIITGEIPGFKRNEIDIQELADIIEFGWK